MSQQRLERGQVAVERGGMKSRVAARAVDRCEGIGVDVHRRPQRDERVDDGRTPFGRRPDDQRRPPSAGLQCVGIFVEQPLDIAGVIQRDRRRKREARPGVEQPPHHLALAAQRRFVERRGAGAVDGIRIRAEIE